MTEWKAGFCYHITEDADGYVSVEFAHEDNDGGDDDCYIRVVIPRGQLIGFACDVLNGYSPFQQTSTTPASWATIDGAALPAAEREP